ncbi:MAG: hypothetical protein ACJ76S_02470 [Solirubrobacteraceae bacterium]|jgi:hypothetical protein
MGVWRWILDVIAEQGEAEQVPIHLERGEDGGYAFRLGVRAGFGGQETARIPVACRPNQADHPILKEIHSCEVAGQVLEAANLFSLRRKVGSLLEAIAPGHSLPLCYFRVPDMDYELPVYEDGDRVVAPVLAGPKLKADDLAGIRQVVCRYLVSAGYVTDPDQVAVGVLRPRDLSRVAPAAVFRSYADPDLWIPSVEGTSADGPVVGLLGQAARLRPPERRRAGAGPVPGATTPAAPDVVEMLRFLRVELGRRAGIEDPSTLYASEVRPEIWASAERHTADTGRRLVAYLSDEQGTALELPVRQTGFGEVVTALEERGINVLLAPDADALAVCIGRYLAAHDFLRFASEIEVHDVAAPRAERLDADSIWTSGDGFAAATAEPEEVHS